MALETILPIILKEIGGQNRLAVFASTDLPRDGAETWLGGKIRGKTTYYPGSPVPTNQILGPEEDPITWSGRFEDRKTGIPGGAQAQAILLNSMRRDGREVLFEYGVFVRRCRFVSFRFKLAELPIIHYEIELDVLDDQSVAKVTRVTKELRTIPFVGNVVAAAEKVLNGIQALPVGVGLDDLKSAAAKVVIVQQAMGSAQAILDTVGDSNTTSFLDPDSAKAAQTFVDAAKEPAKDTNTFLGRLTASDGPGNGFEKTMFQGKDIANVLFDSNQMSGEVLSLAAQVSKLAGASSNEIVHVTADGETLNRVAQRFYGSSDSWTKIARDNGITDPTLVAGQVLVLRDVPARDRQDLV